MISVSLIILIIFAINLLWAVMNWRNEYTLILAVYENPSNWSLKILITAPIFLLGDIVITGTATSIFGFSGFQGSAMAILLSNLLSIFFFTPKGFNKEIIKQYKQGLKNEKNKK
jgi:hypothetical protein